MLFADIETIITATVTSIVSIAGIVGPIVAIYVKRIIAKEKHDSEEKVKAAELESEKEKARSEDLIKIINARETATNNLFKEHKELYNMAKHAISVAEEMYAAKCVELSNTRLELQTLEKRYAQLECDYLRLKTGVSNVDETID